MSTYICATLLLLSIALGKVVYPRMVFNPLTGFFGMWLFDLLVYGLDWYLEAFNVRLSDFADLLLALSFACFFLGCLAGSLCVRMPLQTFVLRSDALDLTKLQTFTYVMLPFLAIGTTWKYQIASVTIGSPFEHMTEIREASAGTGELVYPLIPRFLTLIGYQVVLNLGVLLVLKRNWRVVLLTFVVIGLAFVNDGTVGGRGSTFTSVLLLMSTILITSGLHMGGVRVRHLLGALCLLVSGTMLIMVIVYLRSDRSVVYTSLAITNAYAYLVGTVPAMSVFLEEPWPTVLPGQWTFGGLYQVMDACVRVVGFGSIIGGAYDQTYYAQITLLGPFNASNYLTYYHSDMGIPGVIILSVGMGVVAGYFFSRAMKQRTIRSIQLASLMMLMVLFSIRGIATNGMLFWVTLVFILTQSKILEAMWRRKSVAITARDESESKIVAL